jgi:hypothetical protein
MNSTKHSRWMRPANWWPLLASLLLSTELYALTPFAADYDVLENGKRIGSAKLDLIRSGPDRWTFSTVTEGEGGVAGLLGARISERSELQLDADGQLRTVDYRYNQEVAWRDRTRSLVIDPKTGAAQEQDRKRSWTYPTSGPVLDRHAVVLAVSLDLSESGHPQSHAVAHKGEVDDWTFDELGEERVQTDLGDLPAIKLERVRQNKERSTISWHAASWKYLPVVIEQVEPDGKRYRMVLQRWRKAP